MYKCFVCLGSLNWDITFPIARLPEEHEKCRADSYETAYGGAAANTAFWLGKLRMPTSMLGAVGDDDAGRGSLSSLRSAGVDVSDVQCVPGSKTGIAIIFASGDSKRMVTAAGAGAFLLDSVLTDAIEKRCTEGTHIHTVSSQLSRSKTCLVLARSKGASISCDLNGNFDIADLQICNMIFINHTDLYRTIQSDDIKLAIVALKLLPHQLLVVTKGSAGSEALFPGTTVISCPAVECRPVDRTGGGDAFNAGFLYGLNSLENDISAALKSGQALASEIISYKGTRPREANLSKVFL